MGKRAFLLTAAHTINHLRGEEIATLGVDGLVAIEGRRLGFAHEGNSVDADVALIELQEDEALAIETKFDSTLVDDMMVTSATEGRLYAMVGYPHSQNRPVPRSVTVVNATAKYIVTSELAELPHRYSSGKNELAHFALWAPGKNFRDASDRRFVVPKPHGMSGGGVWRIDATESFNVNGRPQLVGVVIEYIREKEVFVATRTGIALLLLAQEYGVTTPRTGA